MKKKLIVLLTCIAVSASSVFTVFADETDDRIAEIKAQITELQEELSNLESQKNESLDEEIADVSSIEKTYILSAGNYTAGIDIPTGICNVTAVSGQGNLNSSNLYNGGVNEMFGIDDGSGWYNESFNGLKVPDDVVLTTNGLLIIQLDYTEITGGAVGRTYDETKSIQLSSGIYTSGKDFDAGTYNIVAVSGTGNLSSSNLYDGGVNEMFGVDDGSGWYNSEIKNIPFPEGVELTVSGGLVINIIPEE